MQTTPEKQSDVSQTRRKLLQYAVAGVLTGGLMPIFSSSSPAHAASPQRVLIAYYSRTGNTRTVAEHIHTLMGGDMLEIKTVHPYPQDYKATTEQAKKELAEGYKPPLSTQIPDISGYECVFVGSPNWWNTVAPVVMTFLSACNWNGKTIAPFITHEGSALGRCTTDIQKLCPGAKVLDGLAVRGRSAASAHNDVAAWLQGLGLRA